MNELMLNYINVEQCKAIINTAKLNGESTAILVSHYSINIQSKYMDGEALQYDLDELEIELKCNLTVSDYDDLVASW